MASTNSTVDGMGFEEINQTGSQTANIWITGSLTASQVSGGTVYAHNTYAETLSGTSVYGVYISGDVLYGHTSTIQNLYVDAAVSGAAFRDTTIGGALKPTAIDNATELFGYRVKAGSVLMGNSISGLISFPSAGSFSTPNYFLALTAREYNAPQWSRTGSQSTYCGSGIRRASGCWIVGGSATVVDWIAVGI